VTDLIGKQIHSIDAKGRMIVPAKFRDSLGSEFVVALGLDNCLNLYPMEEWGKLLMKLKETLSSSDETRRFLNFLSANSEQVEADKQGRVILPTELRAKVGIVKDVVTVGALDKIRVFAKEFWDEYSADITIRDIAATAAAFNIPL